MWTTSVPSLDFLEHFVLEVWYRHWTEGHIKVHSHRMRHRMAMERIAFGVKEP